MATTENNTLSGPKKMTIIKASKIYSKLKHFISYLNKPFINTIVSLDDCHRIFFINGCGYKAYWMPYLKPGYKRPTFVEFLRIYNIDLIEGEDRG